MTKYKRKVSDESKINELGQFIDDLDLDEIKYYQERERTRLTRGANAQSKVVGNCGAQRRGHKGPCQQAAGWGTKHYGIGRCRFHGGNSPTHVMSASNHELRQLLGKPMDINPLDALLMCIRIRAGEVKWLGDRMAELDEEHWVEQTIMGKQFHLYARERQKALQDLARYSSMAISLGIAERAVKLAETYGEMLAALIKGILGDLDLDAEQRAKVPMVVRKHLLAIDGGGYASTPDGTRMELTG